MQATETTDRPTKPCRWCGRPFSPRRPTDRFCPAATGRKCRLHFHEYRRPRVDRAAVCGVIAGLHLVAAGAWWWPPAAKRLRELAGRLREEIGPDRPEEDGRP